MVTNIIENSTDKSPRRRRKRKRKTRKIIKDNECLQSKDGIYNRSDEQRGQRKDNGQNKVKCTTAASLENGFNSAIAECDMPDTHLEVDSTLQLPKCEHPQVLSNSSKNSKRKRNRKKRERIKRKANDKECLPSMNEMDAECDLTDTLLEVDSTLQLLKCEHVQVLSDSIKNLKQKKNKKKQKRTKRKANDKECQPMMNKMDNKLDKQHGQGTAGEPNKVKSIVANPLQSLEGLKNEKNFVIANFGQVDTLLEVDSAPHLPISEHIDVATGSIVNPVEATTKRKKKRKRRKKITSKANDEERPQSVDKMDNKSNDQHGLRKDGEQNEVNSAAAREESKPYHSQDSLFKISQPLLQRALVSSLRRKLLILDVNGLLADIVLPPPKECRADIYIAGRAIFRRPFYYDFLKFCFEKFDVGIWSSRSKKVVDRVVAYLLEDLRHNLLFCWDMSQCTETGYKTLENRHKPLVCKELRKIWEKHNPNLPWKKGDYNESNTLLLDDSPYKALFNPMHTAVFPYSYHYKDRKDNSLGPGGDLRVYLEELAAAEDIQNYVEHHPYGQSAINETSSFWGFYSEVLHNRSLRLTSNVSDMS